MPHPQCLQEVFFTVLEALVYNIDSNVDLLSRAYGTILDCMLCSLLVSVGLGDISPAYKKVVQDDVTG